ncbi:MAG TPA: protein kinase [Vicinamibacterales bacterium]
MIGQTLGPYQVLSKLGEGGMGEVYRATDTRLGRNVAIKVLPVAVAQDAERLARFDREARTLASLNHPNIAQIYGLEDANGVKALVMELVEGPTLADRIAEGPVPIDQVIPLATQIADALDAAHEQGIVHRDLKPANIKVRPDGTVKVLDFGLAKAMEPASAVRASAMQAPSQAPTITSPAMTQMGMILGTAAYMAPEQASGKPVDKRADIWAFGVVLWETLAGRPMFEGETVAHVLAAVLTKEPDLTAVSPRVRHLLTRCLEKDPKKRLRDIGDAISLVQAADGHAGTLPVAGSRQWLAVGGWAAAGVAAAVAAAAWFQPAPVVVADPPMVRFQIERSPDVYNRTATAFAVSPDGLSLAYYGAGKDGPQTLLLRTLATGEVREVPNSATAAPQRESLFWSPDSRQLARGTASGGQVFDVTSGRARRLCDCRWVGGSWSSDGTILLGGLGPGSGISRLSADDRTPVAVTTVEVSRGEQDTWPVFLPGGRRFLFTRSTRGGESATYLGTLDGEAPKRIIGGSQRAFVPAANGRGGHLLGIDASGLVAQPFDPDTTGVTGTAITLVARAIAVSASDRGVLATSAAGSRPTTVPTWFDRTGASLGQVGQEGLIDSVALSPDGRRLAVTEGGTGPQGPGPGQGSAIWLRDLVTGARQRLTFNTSTTPVWSADGARVAFTSPRDGLNRLFQRTADGTGEATPLFAHDGHAWVNDWSLDGRWVIYSNPQAGRGGNDLWAMPMEDGTARKAVPYLVTPALEQQAQFSPDGRFVAYGSDQSGTWEIYVQPFPNASGGKWLVSNGGGAEPRWSRDGKELFYFAGQALMAVPVSVRPTFSNGAPVALFDAPIQPGYTADSHRWQVTPDATRFLLLANAGKDQAQPLDVVVNWPALLTK